MEQDRSARPLYASLRFHVAVITVSGVGACLAAPGLKALIDAPEASAMAELIAGHLTTGVPLVERDIDHCMELLHALELGWRR